MCEGLRAAGHIFCFVFLLPYFALANLDVLSIGYLPMRFVPIGSR